MANTASERLGMNTKEIPAAHSMAAVTAIQPAKGDLRAAVL
jgi:hypothetical protein